MSLLKTVTELTAEINYVSELQTSIKDRFHAKQIEDDKLRDAVIAELDALKAKLASLIEAPAS